MIISVINAKGGTGKTTTAIYLATALANTGHKITIIDLDRQGSATSWIDRIHDKNLTTPFNIIITNINRLPREINKLTNLGHTIIIDTPPGDPSTIEAAITASSFVILPVQASPIEVERMWSTLPHIGTTPHGILITSARQGTKSLNQVQEMLDQHQVPNFKTVIPIREEIRTSFGNIPHNLEGYDDIAQKITEAHR